MHANQTYEGTLQNTMEPIGIVVDWLKTNSGKTYAQAIEAYYQILEEKKKGKTVIDRQFEYNTYIRDFFEANPGKTLQQAIACWKYKKALPGHNRYEDADLSAVKDL